jgi:hypothetical protein
VAFLLSVIAKCERAPIANNSQQSRQVGSTFVVLMKLELIAVAEIERY